MLSNPTVNQSQLEQARSCPWRVRMVGGLLNTRFGRRQVKSDRRLACGGTLAFSVAELREVQGESAHRLRLLRSHVNCARR